ncbi:MAG: PIN domain-containing protein [Armatimonadetes bacterium]|nr:PIN domain-containing protein [Armatimonadota bacterium]
MRIFLDANILFSAAKTDGAIRPLLALLRKAGHECRADGFVIEEARRNLVLKAADGKRDLDGVFRHIKVAMVQPGSLTEGIDLDEKDRPVLAAAIRLECEALLTGDSTHFGHLYGQTIQGVTIHSPRTLAEKLLP